MERELRRNQSILRLSGIAVIVFELWSIIKWLAYFIYDPSRIRNLLSDAGIRNFAEVIFWAVVVILILIDAVIRLYVGKAAIDVAKGKKRSIIFIVVGILIVMVTIFSMVQSVLPGSGSQWDDIVLLAIVDASSVFIGVELIVAAIRVRSIEREMKK